MHNAPELVERRTSADVVFDYLHEQIGTLQLLPGAKISEAEIASQFGVSRQPVRDAFSRLGNLDLLLIRPQKATVVRKFSIQSISKARFVRLSVELEVARKAATSWDGAYLGAFEANLKAQHSSFEAKDVDAFHGLDYEFHKLLCRAADAEFAFEVISENKARVDRLCVLSLTAQDGMRQLIADHEAMIGQLKSGDQEGLGDTVRLHLSRLDETVADIHASHSSYFE